LGLAAKVLLPGLASGECSLTELIIHLFPAGLRGLVLVGILAAIMSTGDICVLTASANVTNDIYHRFLDRNASDKKLLRLGMAVSLCVGVASALFAWYLGDIISILFVAFTINSAGLFLPTVLGMFWRRASAKAAVGSMVTALVVVLGWYIAANLGAGGIFQADPLWPGFLVSAAVFFGICLFGKQSPQEKARIEVFMSHRSR
jgi:SSS family solute:Na+ symporter